MVARELAGSPHTAVSAPARSEEGVQVALVVDADAVSRRFVELALATHGGFVVESALDAAGAIDTLCTHLVDCIVSELDLNDMNGLQLFRRLSQERRLRGIPFVVLSSDKRASTKVAALRAGVDDYLTKPVDAAEFAARAVALVDRQRRIRESLRRRSYTLAGEFSAMPFTDLISVIEMGRRSGVLSVATPSAVGQVYFDEGRVIHAVYMNLTGRSAIYQLVAESEGSFEFSPGPSSLSAEQHTIAESAMALIMEGARIFDTERASRPGVAVTSRRLRAESTVPPAGLKPPLTPETTLGGLFELAVRDQFALGELRLWTPDELARWTASDGSRDRLHVALIADLPEGVSAILSLAGAPSERWVLGSLGPEKKSFGLSFFFRHERTLDVVLIDAQDPGAVETCLSRVPSFVVVAPPDGDFFALGVKARVALERLLHRLGPPAIIGVGNPALDGALRDVTRDLRASVVRCAEGRLGEGSCDLRTLLIRGIRLWTSTGPPRDTPPEPIR